MSYDYNALVTDIAAHRRQAATVEATNDSNNDNNSKEQEQVFLQQALESFESLSSHCPMTPLLWMQYAATTGQLIQSAFPAETEQERAVAAQSALETRLQTLELGLQEFPGSALLHWHYLLLMLGESISSSASETTAQEKENTEKMEKSLNQALEQVGLGSHRNEGDWVAAIYRLQAQFYARAGRMDKVVESFGRRAATPMKEANDSILQEFQSLCREYNLAVLPEHVSKIEEGRRREAKQFGRFYTWEDEVDVAMHKEGILARHHIGGDGAEPDWDIILQSGDQRYGMGLGGQETATAFVKYALAYHKCPWPRKGQDDNDDEAEANRPLSGDELSTLAIAVYERGVAECPTVESIWLSFIRCLVENVQRGNPLESLLQSVVNRAVRNCPFSLALVQHKLNVALLLAERGAVILDPDTLMETVREALDTKFLPGPTLFLELYMTAIMTVKSRILFLISRESTPTGSTKSKSIAYDDAEPLTNNSRTKKNIPLPPSKNIDPETSQEVHDLCADVVEMYDSVETLLRQNHPSWPEGRSLILKERAQTEAILLTPLRAIFDGKVQPSSPDSDEAMQCFEKAIRAHAPPHPDSYSVYIQHFMCTVTPSTEMEMLTKLRHVRGLYQKAVNAVGKPKASAASVRVQPSFRDFETALSCLCHEWILFESVFGSERSRSRASKAIEKKLQKANISNRPTRTAEPQHTVDAKGAEAEVSSDKVPKRKLDDDNDAEQPAKKQKIEEQVDGTTPQEDTIEKPTASKKTLPKVHIGNLEYPAHPFTIRVSNLSLDTEDMDLVDAFRSKCGAIVHAKIMREKHLHQGKAVSKGYGLVQFEEREAVEKALELDDVVGIREKVVNVGRSHVPASSIVPPGMHRVIPMGEGKSSKRNQKRREQKLGVADVDKNQTAKPVPPSSEKKKEAKEESKVSAKAQPTAFNLLAFRPRSVGRSKAQRKPKLSLGDKGSEGNKG
jgi:RNA recognition motif-containing protein